MRERSERSNFFATSFHRAPNHFSEPASVSSEDVSEYLIKEGRQILDFTTPSRSKLVRSGSLETSNGAFERNQDKRIDNTVNGWIVPSGSDEGGAEELGKDPIWVVTRNSNNDDGDGNEQNEEKDESWVVQDNPQLDNGNQDHVWTLKEPSVEDGEEENSNVLPDSWTVQDITGTEPFTIKDARNPSFTIIKESINSEDATEYSTDPDSPLNSVTWVDSDNNGWEEVGSRNPVEFSVTPIRTKPKQRPRPLRSKRKPSLFQNWLGSRFGSSQRSFFREWLDYRLGTSYPRERQTIRLRRPSTFNRRPNGGRHFHSPRQHHVSHSSHSASPHR